MDRVVVPFTVGGSTAESVNSASTNIFSSKTVLHSRFQPQSLTMYDLTPILSFAAINEVLQERLRAKDYGKIEDHLDALDSVKMYMPEVLDSKQQVHVGLLLAMLINASNNPPAMQAIKDTIDKKWLVTNPEFPNSKVPKNSHYTPGNILTLTVGCSRDPYFNGELLDNPRCASQFRDDLIEKVHHLTLPVYVDASGNMKLYSDAETDVSNVFMEDITLNIALNSWQFLFDRGVRTVILSKSGKRGFEKVKTLDLTELLGKGKCSDNVAMWVMLAVVAILVVVGITTYTSYVSHTIHKGTPYVPQVINRPLPVPYATNV